MRRFDWSPGVRGLVAFGVLATAVAVGGCGDGAATGPEQEPFARIWIDDGPDKPQTNIQISVAADVWISLTVRDVESEHVRLLHEGVVSGGAHVFVWDGRDDGDDAVASGPYWVVLSDGQEVRVRAMMLLK